MKKEEAQERPQNPETLRPQPDAGTTQELSRAEILAFLERTKKDSTRNEPQSPGRPSKP